MVLDLTYLFIVTGILLLMGGLIIPKKKKDFSKLRLTIEAIQLFLGVALLCLLTTNLLFTIHSILIFFGALTLVARSFTLYKQNKDLALLISLGQVPLGIFYLIFAILTLY